MGSGKLCHHKGRLFQNKFKNMNQTAAPVLQKERIAIIDSLRGVAILGILLMNIPAFSSAGDPFIRNEFGTINIKYGFS